MRALALTLRAAVALACAGCPGAIDDPEVYRAIRDAREAEAGLGSLDDAGSEASDAAAGEDAESTQVDAGLKSKDSGPGGERDAEAIDAGDEEPAPDAGEREASVSALCDFKALMTTKCGDAPSCHQGAESGTRLDLVSDGLAARLMGMQGSDECVGRPMLDLENPAQSVFYLRVSGTSCGVRMPLGDPAVDEADQACILSWIEQL